MDPVDSVDYQRPMPVFPLPHVVLLPHVVQPLHIFEPRYRQMVRDLISRAADSGAHFAMATLGSSRGESVTLRPVVCISEIVEHQALPDGRSNIAVRGLCRARITGVHDPDDERAYHLVNVAPIEPSIDLGGTEAELPGERERLRQLLAGPRLRRMTVAPQVLQWIDRDDVPTAALLELIGYALLCDSEQRYRLLAEPMPGARAKLLRHELRRLDTLVAQVDEQGWQAWPKGLSWN